MSFDFDNIVQKYKKDLYYGKNDVIIINKILGECIFQDILSTTLECKPTWSSYDRYSLIKSICEKLEIPWRFEIPESVLHNFPRSKVFRNWDSIYYEPYRPDNF